MKIILKKDWDVPINSPIEEKQQGYFVGRNSELSLLVNEILRKNSGAILVSGYRGVGKTSLVYKALWETKFQDKNIIPIVLNASQLEAEIKNRVVLKEGKKSGKVSPRWIIENLIRRLYSTTREKYLEKELEEEITKLYRKAIAKEFKLIEAYQRQREKSLKEILEEKEEFIFSGKDLNNIIFLLCWTISLFFLFGDIVILNESIINKILALLFLYPFPKLFSFVFKKQKIKKDIEMAKGDVKELYEFDDKITNLEFDLEEIHRKFYKKGKKLVYIIDELDKLTSDQVKEVLKYFKNLFTLSSAIFIFVGGEEVYKIGDELNEEEKGANLYRSKEYTYFTTRYFVSRPLWNDLREFFNEIIEQKDVDSKDLEILERSIAFDAKNDFFDLKKFINDRITGFDSDGNPIIEMSEIGDDDIKKARFQKSVTALFEDKYISNNPSMWDRNERILRRLFEYAQKVYNSYSGIQFTDPSGEGIEDEAIRDFNNFLGRNGAFSFQNEKPHTIRGAQIPIRDYSYVGSFPKDPPDFFSAPTEIESRFVKIFKDYGSYILALNNAFQKIQGRKEISHEEFWENPTQYLQQINDWGFDVLSIFDANHPTYKNIIEKEFSAHKREEIEQKINQISNHIKLMIQNFPTIISKMLISLNPSKSLQNQRLQENTSLFSGSANEIRNALMSYNPSVVFNSDLSRQILLIFNQLDTLLPIKKHIRDNASTHRIGCVVEDSVSGRIRGLHFINAKSPEDLKRSLIGFIRTINRFLEK